MTDEAPIITRSLDDLVHQEIYYNISALMSRLQELEPDTFIEEFLHYDNSPDAVEEFLDNSVSITDLKEALVEYFPYRNISFLSFDEKELLAEKLNFEPEPIEIYEYWIISDWLADKLEQEWAEVVVRDYHGLTIWGRAATGQAISMDSVFQNIHKSI